MSDKIDTAKCPLCGGDNRCVMAGDKAGRDQPCWCRAEKFPRELLEQVPPELRNKACICAQCVKKFHANN